MALDQGTIDLLEKIDELNGAGSAVSLQRVPDGNGGYDHRIAINTQDLPTYKQSFTTPEEALDFLNTLGE